MLHFPSSVTSSPGRPAPKRTDSLNVKASTVAAEEALLAALPDEIRDARRVQDYGQEEDLKFALGRMIDRVEELSRMLSQANKIQSELETSLKLARSNLQLALANNEMLEDALKRETASGGKDVGWRRFSGKPGRESSVDGLENSPQLQQTGHQRTSSTPSISDTSAPTSPSNAAVGSASATVSPQPSNSGQPEQGRFFRFRFGSGATSPNPNVSSSAGPSRPQSPVSRIRSEANHLTSASLPSLVQHVNQREDELVAQLKAEQEAHRAAVEEKSKVEKEIESLSAALFEEANKMVAQERIKCAEMEEELRQIRAEKEALKSALRLIEQENEKLMQGKTTEKKTDADATPSNAPQPLPASASNPTITEPPESPDPSPTISLSEGSDKQLGVTLSWTPPDLSSSPIPKSPLVDLPVENPWGK